MSSEAVPPLVAAQLNYLLHHSPLTVRVERMWSGSKHPRVVDRFTIIIPYCLEFIRWDLIYNAESLLSAPDVVFAPEDESFHPLSTNDGEVEGNSNSLRNIMRDWNSKDPSRLTVLILELRRRYMSYQRKRVGEVDDDRLKFEISTMLSREGIEMYMSSGVEKCPEEVKFAVPVTDLDINKLVPGCPWRHPQKIHLQVIYPVGKKYESAPSAPRLKLVSTPGLRALFSVEDVKLPSWLDGMCMAEYLPHLQDSVEKQVLEAASLIKVRRHFIEALASLFGMPLEVDPVFCRRATVLGISGVFTFLVHFYIPTQFPKQQPAIMLQSSQHFNSQGAPIKSPMAIDYPWSPRWEASQMAERIFEFLADEALNFKRHCNETQLQ